METRDAKGLWGLPFWTHTPLILMGLWFLLLPLPFVFGLRWEFYGLGLIGAAGLGWWVRRNYRYTLLEKSDDGDVLVIRSERLRRGAPR